MRVGINTDGSNPNLEGSSMFLRNLEGGELGYDTNDGWGWPGRPPGSPDVWLRAYSDQYRIYYNDPDDVPLRIDARPYSGPDANQPFPLRADVQGLGEGETVSANNCYFTFQAQNGYGTDGGYRDIGLRDLYCWTLRLYSNYAQFTDGTHTKTGVFDLAQGQTFNTLAFHISNVPPNTAFLEFDLTPVGLGLYAVVTEVEGPGTVQPHNPSNLVSGHTTNFVITVTDSDYHIGEIRVDGQTVYSNGSNRGMSGTNVSYTVGGSNGWIWVKVVESRTTNGIPLSWLTSMGVTNKGDEVELEDGDGDGYTTLEEYIAGTHPLNATSGLGRVQVEWDEGFLVGFDDTRTDRVYWVEERWSLLEGGWNVVTGAPGSGGVWRVSIPVSGTQGFYRGKVTLP